MNEKHILIIDDNPDDIELCIRSLKKAAPYYVFSVAKDGAEGIKTLNEVYPDCVLLDYALPGNSGLEVLSDVIANTPFTPVILMSGQGNEAVAVDAIKKGAENYLVKSTLNRDLLHDTIKSAIDKKQLEKKLAEKEQELNDRMSDLIEARSFQDLVIETFPGYLFIKDQEFKIIRANESFLSLYPSDRRDKVIGFTTFEQYPVDEMKAFLQYDIEAFNTGRSEVLETITFPNGDIRTLRTQKVRFKNTKGELFILGIAVDVTETATLINQLKRSNSDLEQFAYVASHDLRSPLTAIKRLIGWLEEDFEDSMPEGMKEPFEMIKNRADRLSILLSDLLDYSRVEQQLTPEEPLQFDDIVRDIFNMEDRSERFELSVSPARVHLPKSSVQIVFINLLNNTIKHHQSREGRIVVEINKAPGGYLIDYKDDGPGIDKKYAQKVFKMFQTLRPRDEVEGSGMGLAIIEKVVAHYKGSIDLIYGQSTLNGAHFRIFWPTKNNKIEHGDAQ